MSDEIDSSKLITDGTWYPSFGETVISIIMNIVTQIIDMIINFN